MSKLTNFIKKLFSKDMVIGGTVVVGAMVALQPDNMAVEKDATNELTVKVATMNSDKWTYEQSEAFVKKYAEQNSMLFTQAKKELLFNHDFLDKADARYIETAIRVERKRAENRGETFDYCLERVKPIEVKNEDLQVKKDCVKFRPQR